MAVATYLPRDYVDTREKVAVLRLKNVRREKGRSGEGTGLHAGPFPNNFVVAFD